MAGRKSHARSRQPAFSFSIKSIFFVRVHPLICFSRSMAAIEFSVHSNHTSRLMRYFDVKPCAACR